MKKVLALVTVIALMASVASATTTLEIWTTLVGGVTATPDYSGNSSTGLYNIGTPTAVAVGPTMPLGLYGVQVWAEVLGETAQQGIYNMSVSLYTLNGNGGFQPMPYASTNGNAVDSLSGTGVVAFGPVDATAVHMTTGLTPGIPNPGTDLDAYQFTIGATTRTGATKGLGVGAGTLAQQNAGAPVLLTTQVWDLTSLPHTGAITVVANLFGNAQTWTGTGNNYTTFDNVVVNGMVIPEPITMTMIGLGIVGLGGYIRRRVKVAA